MSSEPDEQGVRLVDISPIDASLARLIADEAKHDEHSFLREWVAFLGPNGHLRNASHTQVGQQIAEIIREEAASVGLRSVKGGFVQIDASRTQRQTTAPISEMHEAASIQSLPAVRSSSGETANAVSDTRGSVIDGTSNEDRTTTRVSNEDGIAINTRESAANDTLRNTSDGDSCYKQSQDVRFSSSTPKEDGWGDHGWGASPLSGQPAEPQSGW